MVSTRAINKSLKAIDAFLVERAIQQALEQGNDYVHTLVKALPKKLSPADRDMLNEFLGFGSGVLVEVIKGQVTF